MCLIIRITFFFFFNSLLNVRPQGEKLYAQDTDLPAAGKNVTILFATVAESEHLKTVQSHKS